MDMTTGYLTEAEKDEFVKELRVLLESKGARISCCCECPIDVVFDGKASFDSKDSVFLG